MLAGVVIALLAGGCAVQPPRVDKNIDQDWRFIRQDVAGARALEFDDSAWQSINLPHTWNNLDGQDGGNDYYRGPAWYRRKLAIKSSDAGKSFFLRFDGAATATDVFVNGKPGGVHHGNFGAFCFDITDLVRPGKENVLAVRVDNSHSEDIPPLSGDFTIFGGLYRDVHLLVLDPVSVSPLDDASSGVYLKQVLVDDASAELEVTAKLRNGFRASRAATVVCTIVDPQWKIVKTARVRQQIAPRGQADAMIRMTLDRPHLWNGRNDPYLYRAIVDVRDGATVTDRVAQPLGLRYFAVDPNRGLILNGKPYPLHGVNRHQDRWNKGWAIGPSEQEEDFRIICEMGCTGVRLCHFQQADLAYEWCDRLGLVCWAEDGLVNKINATSSFSDSAKQQVRELVKQNYNHPSIFFWSLFNELAMTKDVNPDDAKLIGELNDLAHKLDPTRLTTCATHKKASTPEVWITDLTAFNRYFGWYSGTVSDWPRALDELHAQHPDRRIGISEYGAGASVKQHELSPTTRPRTGGPWHPEEWQAIIHENAWRAMKDRPWLWCEFLWVMFDFAADQRKEGDQLGRNDKGLVTADRKVRKDAFYFYQANWTDTPLVHIAGRRFDPRPSGPGEIKVYSNCDSVELLVNGKSLGGRSGDTCVFTWPGVTLPEGTNLVRAVGTRNGRAVMDGVTWTASAGATTRLTTP